MFVALLASLASAGSPADAPEGTQTARGLLLARHASDLPSHEVLLKHGGAASLTWLATNDPSLSVRERALLGLRGFEAADRVVCRSVFRSDAHAKLRAAAIRCHSVEDLADPSFAAELDKAVDDPDRRVSVASAELLGQRTVKATPTGE